ncbi:MAG: hypothetical protein ABW031_03505 [Methyloceanibacter sp.]
MNRREFVIASATACLAAAATTARLARSAPAPHYRCGTVPSTPSEDIQATRVTEALRAHGVAFRYKTVIPVRFHIIHAGAQGYVSHRRLKAQMALLNRIYAPAGLAFTIADARLHENKAWFTHEPGSRAEIEMKTELGKDTARTLNIYTAEPGGALSGYATVPWSRASTPVRDGIVIHHASLPERPASNDPSPFVPGMAAVHQLGHWAGGLSHAIEDSCETQGACVISFTPEQYERIRDLVGYYRFELSPQASRSALLAQIRKSIE